MKFEVEDIGQAVGLDEVTDALYEARAFDEAGPIEDLPTPFRLTTAADRVGLGGEAVEIAMLDAFRLSEPVPGKLTAGVASGFFSKKGTQQLAKWLHLSSKEQQPRLEVSVPWFATHAPRAGNVRATHTTQRTRGGSIGLSVFGSTLFRAGRSLAITASDDTEDREVCTVSSLVLEGTPTRYSYKKTQGPWELEDLMLVREIDEDLDPCPYCSITPSQIDLSQHERDPIRDRRTTQSRRRLGDLYKWTKKSSFTVPIPVALPHIPIPIIISLGFVSTTDVSWDLKWTLSGGYAYQAYWRAERVRTAPPMWAAEP
jgi:hypothetical protein